jgi:hypothetical protein
MLGIWASSSQPRIRFTQWVYPDRTSLRVVVPARQAGNRFLGSLKGLHIKALRITSLFLQFSDS